ncbi:MAG: class I SAM-dependent methyltransferase [Pseudomonadota bacterium]
MSDTGFSSPWLDLREPADHAARHKGLLSEAAKCARRGKFVLDLGSGTGSTARAFDGLLPDQKWRFFDADEGLLEIASARHPQSEKVAGNLADIEALPLEGVGLVTASALLDLMPQTWIEALAQRLKAADLPIYAALNYDGRMTWTPALPKDEPVANSFNQHQQTNKGLGRATGPQAANVAKRIFGKLGFDVRTGDSPWRLNGEHAALQDELLTGIAIAATEAGSDVADNWLQARRGVAANATCVIGHTDVLAIPA